MGQTRPYNFMLNEHFLVWDRIARVLVCCIAYAIVLSSFPLTEFSNSPKHPCVVDKGKMKMEDGLRDYARSGTAVHVTKRFDRRNDALGHKDDF